MTQRSFVSSSEMCNLTRRQLHNKGDFFLCTTCNFPVENHGVIGDHKLIPSTSVWCQNACDQYFSMEYGCWYDGKTRARVADYNQGKCTNSSDHVFPTVFPTVSSTVPLGLRLRAFFR